MKIFIGCGLHAGRPGGLAYGLFKALRTPLAGLMGFLWAVCNVRDQIRVAACGGR